MTEGSKQLPIKFSATPWGYSKVWLVNVLLTIVTLGIYGPWAKVRNTLYLYGHTSIDDHRLQFLAKPVKILIGRLIALGIFLVYIAITSFAPEAGILFAFVFVFAMPWLINQGLRFNLVNTAYRNVRFDFKGSYWETFLYFMLLPLASLFTLYLLMPWVLKEMDKYIHENIEYGGKRLELNTRGATYYKAAFAAAVVYILFMIVAFSSGLMAGLMSQTNESLPLAAATMMFVFYVAMFVVFYLSQAIYVSITRNHVMNNLEVEDLASFESNIKISSYLTLTLTNVLLLVVTLGLAFPATQARKFKYLADHTQINLTPEIDNMVNKVTDADASIGEEAASLFDTDISII